LGAVHAANGTNATAMPQFRQAGCGVHPNASGVEGRFGNEEFTQTWAFQQNRGSKTLLQ